MLYRFVVRTILQKKVIYRRFSYSRDTIAPIALLVWCRRVLFYHTMAYLQKYENDHHDTRQ